MKNFLALLGFVVAASFPSEGRSTDDIDVLIAVSAAAIEDDSAQIAGDMQAAMNLVLSRSNMSNRQFQFRPYLLVAAYPDSGVTDAGAALSFLTGDVDALLSNARDTGSLTVGVGVTSYDLVVMVVEGLEDGGKALCGVAFSIYHPVDGYSPMRDDAAESTFAIVLSDEPNCRGLVRDATIAHEIGHVFGGNHQSNEQVAGVVNNPFTDPDWDTHNFPVKYNHPMLHVLPNNEIDRITVMANKASGLRVAQYSSDAPGDVIFQTPLAAGNADADMKKLVYAWWDAVADFRPPKPEPEACDLTWSYNGCNSFFKIIVTANLSGYTVTNMNVDQQYGTSGPWYDIFEGIFSCPGFNPSTLRTVRAILTTPQGTSECYTVINPPSCNSNPW